MAWDLIKLRCFLEEYWFTINQEITEHIRGFLSTQKPYGTAWEALSLFAGQLASSGLERKISSFGKRNEEGNWVVHSLIQPKLVQSK